jgi:hypothetical protein
LSIKKAAVQAKRIPADRNGGTVRANEYAGLGSHGLCVSICIGFSESGQGLTMAGGLLMVFPSQLFRSYFFIGLKILDDFD